MSTRTLLALAATGVLTTAASSASAQVLFSDDFETAPTPGKYTTVVQTDPSLNQAGSVFNPSFAYSNLGVAGDVRSGTGALFETNGSITAFLNPALFSVGPTTGPISIKYDAYYAARSGGSTESSTLGVGAGTNAFELFLDGGVETTQGVFVTASTDSDTAAGGDYDVVEGSGGGKTVLFDGDAGGTTQSGQGFGVPLPEIPNVVGAGVADTRFVEVEIVLNGQQVTYNLNGVEVATVTASVPTVGQVGFGLTDPFFSENNGTGVGTFTGTAIIVDNLVVSVFTPPVVPEPTALAALGLGSLTLLRRRRA